MLKLFANKNFPVFIFVTAAIVNLVLLFTLFVAFRLIVRTMNGTAQDAAMALDANSLESPDPLISRVPKFEDALKAPRADNADPSIGPAEAPVTIVQFSDFKCEFCAKQEEILKKFIKEYGNRVRLVWKDFPESLTASESYQSAVAARCAQRQGKFWEYHDLLYASSGELSENAFLKLAGRLSLNTDDFRQCLGDPAVSKLILDNIDEAEALGINGIPFVYVNELGMLGETGYAEIKRAVDYEISRLQ